jgi:hypothetical protein
MDFVSVRVITDDVERLVNFFTPVTPEAIKRITGR